MESLHSEDHVLEPQQGPVCASCNVPVSTSESSTLLCPSCREHFIRYPIPLWIKLFGGGILVVMLISFVGMQQNLSAGIHFKRGKVAERSRNFRTAQNEYQIVADKNTDYQEAQARLLIAAFYNNDLKTMYTAYSRLENKESKDEELYREVNSILERSNDNFPSDSFNSLLSHYQNTNDSVPENVYRQYIQNNPDDHFALIAFASRAYDKEDYKTTDSLLSIALYETRDNMSALIMKIGTKRQKHELDSALYFIDQRLLNQNNESVYGLSAKSRVMLSKKRDDEALSLAKKANALDEKDGYAMASLALALHYKGDIAARDALIKRASNDSLLTSYFSYVQDVISGKETLRN